MTALYEVPRLECRRRMDSLNRDDLLVVSEAQKGSLSGRSPMLTMSTVMARNRANQRSGWDFVAIE